MSSPQYRKYMITIQHPLAKGFDHDMIRDIVSTMKPSYWCMADEIATTGTPHTHVFIYRNSAIRVDTIQRKFPACHYDSCLGTCAENRDYLLKTGKWADTDKAETSVPGTFEEFGTMPTEREEKNPKDADLIDAIEAGVSTADIIRNDPSLAFRSNEIDVLRQTLTTERFRVENRELTVTYLYGPTATGKTRSIYAAHPAGDICRITNYGTNGVKFDAYHGQPVLVLEEFHSQIPLPDMLNYLDIYPLMLPARYSDRVACYTTVYITSNISLAEQYQLTQQVDHATWAAFIRRIVKVVEFLEDGTTSEHKPEEYL